MDPKDILKGKRVLVVDDEEDILEFLVELLDMCKLDTATSFEEAKALLENTFYDIAVLDIMGVRGYELLETATRKGIPTLMLTAHAISKDNLKRSFEKGASYYVPKDEISKRLSGFCDRRFGPNWKDEDPEFWNSLLGY